jgi:hypothetical protein
MRIKSFTGEEKAAMPPMAVSSAAPAVPPTNELDTLFRAVSVARALNDLSPANDFSVIRDPRTCVVVIAVRHRATGELLDLCPPDALLDILEHLPGQWKGMEE